MVGSFVRFFFTRCEESLNSLVRCAHSFVRASRNSWRKIVRTHQPWSNLYVFGFGFRQGQIRGPPTSSTLFSNQEGPLPNKEMWCIFCNGPHPSNRCAVVTDPETKKNILRQKGRCFGCLRSGHISKNCSTRCYRCGGKHHLSLCSTQKQPMQFRQTRGATQEKTVSTNLYFTQDEQLCFVTNG